MRSSAGRAGKVVRFWRGFGWLSVLAAAIMVFGSLGEAAAQMRGRGFAAPRPAISHRGLAGPRMFGIHPGAMNRMGQGPRFNRPPVGNRNPRAVRPTMSRKPPASRPYKESKTHGNRSRQGKRHIDSGGKRHVSPRKGGKDHAGRPTGPSRPTPGSKTHPRHPPRVTDYPPRRPRPPRIPPLVIPGAIGVIGAIPTQPASADPGYQPPSPPAINNHQPPRRQGPSRTTRGPSGAPPAGEQRLVPDEVVVQLLPGASPQDLAALEARHQLTRLEQQTFQLTGESMVRWRIPDQRSVTAVIVALEADAGVLSAQPNYLFALQEETAASGKGDPAQYAIGKLHLSEAHALARGDKVLIGVIDSGIDVTHPELAGMIAESFDALPGEPPHRHGTAIAGTIVAHARLLGVAPASRILAARAFGASATTAQATTFNIIKGIDWSAKNGARVINMSFAGPRDPAIERELAAAIKLNIVLIAAAGNAGPNSPPLYPAADRNVIAVSATDAQDKLFEQANRGGYITIAAPGVDIIAPAPRGAYQITSGTSIAAAYISGLAALLIERSPTLTPNQVRRALQTTARDLGKRGRDPEFGAGLADAYRALKSIQPRAVESVTSSRR